MAAWNRLGGEDGPFSQAGKIWLGPRISMCLLGVAKGQAGIDFYHEGKPDILKELSLTLRSCVAGCTCSKTGCNLRCWRHWNCGVDHARLFCLIVLPRDYTPRWPGPNSSSGWGGCHTRTIQLGRCGFRWINKKFPALHPQSITRVITDVKFPQNHLITQPSQEMMG